MRRLPWFLGFFGSGLSLIFWVLAPMAGNTYFHTGLERWYAFMIALAVVGMAGSVVATSRRGWGAALMAIGVIPAVGALLVPGLMVIGGVFGALAQDRSDHAHLAT